MDTEMKATWIKALRSGEYTQCFGTTYHFENGKKCNCALGVLAAACLGAEFDENSPFLMAADPEKGWRKAQVGVMFGYEARRRVNMSIPDRDLVVNWNDRCRLTFPEIADKIEEYL